MLIECVKYGKIVCLMTPEGPQFDHRGCVAVTYETIDAARLCAGMVFFTPMICTVLLN